ncbi:hypothetical protein BO78DRAFT_307386 [Aspergillus sclerotiicarbonarius CBS 121057]|uniref:Uncharacterized protein n=1 Tax=Aspergillus sclerotiicarbonarius (strain CBS 121057 / IBT 28362) TaxID=1448318 RepID=A0A319EY63_ASPSB|nr:hypothetical protein BO78DRAFT_307386 [Aspergillus sclerotiicarbonarius CBS 121057]
MATQTLLQYLSISLPTLPLQRVSRSHNTTNSQYNHRDITQILPWPEFNYDSIIQEYGLVLNSSWITPQPFMSPPAAIRDEALLQMRWADMIQPRLRRALRASFEQLAAAVQAGQLTPIQYDGGSTAELVNNFKPDTAFVVLGSDYATSPNRGPGDMKVSWKWNSEMLHSTEVADQIEYRQVLSQVNWYMRQHKSHYGYILTNTEFVAVRRVEETNGRLALATPIPWSAGGPEQLSVLLGLWYLAMLTSRNDWSLEAR